MRCDYLIGTLNPDDPSLEIYKEYINRARPLAEWEDETPGEIRKMLNQLYQDGWVHWFFGFKDNIGVPEEKKQLIITMAPKGTKQYKTKILGLRGRSEGLVFNLDERRYHISK